VCGSLRARTGEQEGVLCGWHVHCDQDRDLDGIAARRGGSRTRQTRPPYAAARIIARKHSSLHKRSPRREQVAGSPFPHTLFQSPRCFSPSIEDSTQESKPSAPQTRPRNRDAVWNVIVAEVAKSWGASPKVRLLQTSALPADSSNKRKPATPFAWRLPINLGAAAQQHMSTRANSPNRSIRLSS
jgi:hypothetical protein